MDLSLQGCKTIYSSPNQNLLAFSYFPLLFPAFRLTNPAKSYCYPFVLVRIFYTRFYFFSPVLIALAALSH